MKNFTLKLAVIVVCMIAALTISCFALSDASTTAVYGTIKVDGKRVKCNRLDRPVGEEGYQIPFGQYAMVLNSDLPIFAVFGRLDTRQANMAFYTVQGHTYED